MTPESWYSSPWVGRKWNGEEDAEEWEGKEEDWKMAAWKGWDEAVGVRWGGKEEKEATWWTKDVEEKSVVEWDQAWWSSADQGWWTKAEEGGDDTQMWKKTRNRPPKWVRDQWKANGASAEEEKEEEEGEKEDEVMEEAPVEKAPEEEEKTDEELVNQHLQAAPWRVTPTVVPARYPRQVGAGPPMLFPQAPSFPPPAHVLERAQEAEVPNVNTEDAGQGDNVEDEVLEVEVEADEEDEEVTVEEEEDTTVAEPNLNGQEMVEVKEEIPSGSESSSNATMESETKESDSATGEEEETEEEQVTEVESEEVLDVLEGTGLGRRDTTRVVELDIVAPDVLRLYCRDCNQMRLNFERICPTCGAR